MPVSRTTRMADTDRTQDRAREVAEAAPELTADQRTQLASLLEPEASEDC